MKIINKKRRFHSIPMSSLADVAFLLLIFLILTSALNLNEKQEVIIPFSEQSRPIENERAFEIIINKQGELFLKGKQIDEWELQNKSLREFSRFPNTVFFIKGDENIAYEKIDTIINIFKKNHIQNIVMMAKRPEIK